MFKRLVLCSALFIFPAHAGTIVYQNDFESGVAGAQISGGGNVVGTQGYVSFGFGNSFFQNATGDSPSGGAVQDPTIIRLTNLPAHDSLNLGFFLAAINSWDGSNDPTRPDIFNVEIDGVSIFSETIANGGPGQSIDTAFRLFQPTELGFGLNFNDTAYDLTAVPSFTSIPHISSSVEIAFFASGQGFQGSLDENFAIDNISISLNGVTAVPEPTVFGIFGLGLLVLLRRRILF